MTIFGIRIMRERAFQNTVAELQGKVNRWQYEYEQTAEMRSAEAQRWRGEARGLLYEKTALQAELAQCYRRLEAFADRLREIQVQNQGEIDNK